MRHVHLIEEAIAGPGRTSRRGKLSDMPSTASFSTVAERL